MKVKTILLVACGVSGIGSSPTGAAAVQSNLCPRDLKSATVWLESLVKVDASRRTNDLGSKLPAGKVLFTFNTSERRLGDNIVSVLGYVRLDAKLNPVAVEKVEILLPKKPNEYFAAFGQNFAKGPSICFGAGDCWWPKKPAGAQAPGSLRQIYLSSSYRADAPTRLHCEYVTP